MQLSKRSVNIAVYCVSAFILVNGLLGLTIDPHPVDLARKRLVERGLVVSADKLKMSGAGYNKGFVGSSAEFQFIVQEANSSRPVNIALRKPLYFFPWLTAKVSVVE